MKTIYKMLVLAVALASNQSMALTVQDLYGTPIPVQAGSRRIVLNDALPHVNVKQFEVVTFVCGTSKVSWVFDGIRTVIPVASIVAVGDCPRSASVYVELEVHA